MRKILFNTASAIIALSIVFTACNSEETVRIESVSLSPAALLHVDSVLDLSATIRPSFATNRAVVWTSSDNAVAIVTESATNPLVGRVTAKELGETTITVTTQDGNHTAVSIVTVTMPAVGSGCNGNLPGWGVSLGIVSFATDQTWTVGNQTWSDAVTVTNCDKVNFYGGSSSNFNADCRSNPGFPGDLFSWCAVIRFQAELCPAPWRVPTIQDFRSLDIAFGGNGNNRTDLNAIIRYVSDWGLPFSGGSFPDGTLALQGTNTIYWTQTVAWVINANGSIGTSGGTHAYFGSALRCVRDNN